MHSFVCLISPGLPAFGCNDICDKHVHVSAYQERIHEPRCQVRSGELCQLFFSPSIDNNNNRQNESTIICFLPIYQIISDSM